MYESSVLVTTIEVFAEEIERISASLNILDKIPIAKQSEILRLLSRKI